MKMAMAICLATIFCMTGCEEKPVADTQQNDKPEDKQVDKQHEKQNDAQNEEQDVSAATPKAKELAVLDYEGIQKLIASHQGKVVVVDAWATYCPSCMRDFHHLVDLHKEYGANKVACVSLSFDYGDDAKLDELKPRVQAFLDLQGATFDNIISNEPWEALYKKFDFSAVPAVFVYGPDGKLLERVDHSGDDETPIYDRVKALVKKHMKAESGKPKAEG